MKLERHLKAIHDARSPRGVAAALGRASMHLREKDDLALLIVQAEARSRLASMALASIRTARDLRRHYAAR